MFRLFTDNVLARGSPLDAAVAPPASLSFYPPQVRLLLPLNHPGKPALLRDLPRIFAWIYFSNASLRDHSCVSCTHTCFNATSLPVRAATAASLAVHTLRPSRRRTIDDQWIVAAMDRKPISAKSHLNQPLTSRPFVFRFSQIPFTLRSVLSCRRLTSFSRKSSGPPFGHNL